MTTPTVIDASPTYQPNAGADAQALHDAGIRRAILKISEGATWPNAGSPEAGWFTSTRDALRAVGIVVEGYHLTHAADAVADEVVNVSRNAGHDVGVRLWVDVENTENNAETMGTHSRSLVLALAHEYGVPVGRYDNRSTDAALEPFDHEDAVWLAYPGWDGHPLAAAVVLVQTGQQQIGAETYDVNVEIETAPPAPVVQVQPVAAAPRFPTIDLRHADARLVLRTDHTIFTLQQLLDARGFHLAVDGKAGPLTKAAAGAFQAHHGLAVDFIVGPLTWHALVSA